MVIILRGVTIEGNNCSKEIKKKIKGRDAVSATVCRPGRAFSSLHSGGTITLLRKWLNDDYLPKACQ